MTAIPEQPADFLRRAPAAVPHDPRALAAGPDTVKVETLHLTVTQQWKNGASHNVHVMENGDLNVILQRGGGHIVPGGEVGTLVVALGVDEDHDEATYTCRNSFHVEEVLSQAIDALVAARWAMSARTVGL